MQTKVHKTDCLIFCSKLSGVGGWLPDLLDFSNQRRRNYKYIIVFLRKMKKFSSSTERMMLYFPRLISSKNMENPTLDHFKLTPICSNNLTPKWSKPLISTYSYSHAYNLNLPINRTITPILLSLMRIAVIQICICLPFKIHLHLLIALHSTAKN
mgnify:CR=1 FL=1